MRAVAEEMTIDEDRFLMAEPLEMGAVSAHVQADSRSKRCHRSFVVRDSHDSVYYPGW